MTREEEIRHECMLQLYGSRPLGISIAHIVKQAQRGGYDYSEREIKTAITFLLDQLFAVEQRDAATGEIRFRITAKGQLHWENRE